ncbi:MAG: hypothetical protein A3F11_11785 [Gammaproteobacteria bacterium RIFCSPHIGHO2_12_FULL_37_14]|nr:MAG: hypothetical protein A3F11_11785 [Gammaproteobacteria bacterium RIFCSPHIGHO2_12_FULL_37_14]
MPRIKQIFCLIIFLFNFNQIFAAEFSHSTYPFYLGITGGYGSTTWEGLVPPRNKQAAALLLSTPSDVSEGGGLWGYFMGYEIIPHFALEASYTHYPNAKVIFDETSLVAFENNGLTDLNTSTDSISLMAKFMITIPYTEIKAFSSAGAARVHRKDIIKECWRISPTFSLGLNYNLAEHIMGEIGFNYTGGYGESELDPAEDYVPFLYSGYLRLAYRLW